MHLSSCLCLDFRLLGDRLTIFIPALKLRGQLLSVQFIAAAINYHPQMTTITSREANLIPTQQETAAAQSNGACWLNECIPRTQEKMMQGLRVGNARHMPSMFLKYREKLLPGKILIS